MTLTGTGFVNGAVVELDGLPAADVVVVSSDTLLCKTPAHAPGVVDVAIVLPDGSTARRNNGFTYVQSRINRTGELDPTFGGGGFVTHDGAAGGASFDQAYGVVVDDQGRIVVAGASRNAARDNDMVVWRYLPDGTPDPAFGNQGIVVHTASAAGGVGWDQGNDVVIDASGRIVVCGYSRSPAGNADLTVWRLLDDGSFDPAFGGQGWATHNDAGGGDNWDVGMGLVIDAQGRIVVAGWSNTPGTLQADLAVWRFLDTGTLDPSFGGKGFVTHDSAAGGQARDEGAAVALDAQGRIVVGGYSNGTVDADAVVWRFLEDGSLDTSFGTQGYVTHHSAAGGGGSDRGRAVAVDAQGRIVLAGSSRGPNDYELTVWRFLDDGTQDPTFGTRGVSVHGGLAGSTGNDTAYGLRVDDKIVAVGNSPGAVGTGFDAVVVQLDQDGSLDTTFGQGQGYVSHHGAAGGDASDQARGMGFDAQGRILVVGSSSQAVGNGDMTVWRYR